MFKSSSCGLSIYLIAAGIAHAACPTFTYTFSNGSTADATQLNTNFNDVITCFAPLASPAFTGNVGIGTNTPADLLDIEGSQSRSNGIKIGTTGGNALAIFDDGNPHIESLSGSTLWINGDYVAPVSINAAGGNVGIGTAAPGSPLTVVRPDNSSSAIASFYPSNLTQSVNVGYNHIFEGGSNGNNSLLLDSQGAGAIVLQGNGGTGNVGIGTTNPTAAGLEIGSGVSGGQAQLQLDNANGATGGLYRWTNRIALASSNAISFAAGSGAEEMWIDASGNIGIGTVTPGYPLTVNGTAAATQFVTTSDRRTKRDIQPLTMNALAIVEKLRPVTFYWKDQSHNGTNGAQIGFVAQDVQTVLPNAVLAMKDSNRTLALKYEALVSVLTKAVQEQQTEIAELTAAINEMKSARAKEQHHLARATAQAKGTAEQIH